jgi:uncharacterized protein with PQ loop repeat
MIDPIDTWPKVLGLVASVTLPLFNIPLMIRMYRRKSSEDLSLVWVIGVFTCIVATIPAAAVSRDLIFRIYQIVNVVFFSGVTFLAVYYRRKKFRKVCDTLPPTPDNAPN